ncbi:MAG: hypothetical protein U1D69_06780, partial [Polynucleobacter sp.]|nr:hypothetical protein [Polynucleobacter sp.]
MATGMLARGLSRRLVCMWRCLGRSATRTPIDQEAVDIFGEGHDPKQAGACEVVSLEVDATGNDGRQCGVARACPHHLLRHQLP